MNNIERQQDDFIKKHLRVVCAVFLCREKILACRRPPGKNMAGLWEFPGGKVEQGESDWTALVREIREEMNITISSGKFIGEYVHSYDDFKITLCPFLVTVSEEFFPVDGEHDAVKWVSSSDWETLEWPAADRPVLDTLYKFFQ